MEDKAKCGHSLYWFGCYRGTYDVVSPSSMAHPAKMSVALCYRILQHLEELGLIKQGDKVLDPMAGTGITNICAGAMGYPSISVELEEKFVGFQKENKEYAERRLYKPLDWTMLKGDSRRLSELLKTQGLKSVTSPPYESSLNNTAEQKGWDKLANDPTSSRYGRKSIPSVGAEYSDNPDNIGNLKDTPLKSITSPPYANRVDDHGVDQKGYEGFTDKLGEYGESEGQIGKLKDKPLKSIVSPPYGEALSGGGIAQYGHYSDPELAKRIYSAENTNPEERTNIEKQIERVKQGRAKMKRPDVFTSEGNKAAKGYFEGNYSRNPENIGNLKDTPLKAITSPPYGETGVGDWKTGRAEFQAWVINEIKTKGYVEWQGKRYSEAEWRAMNHGRIDGRTTKGVHKHPTDGYSDNPDNIGGLPDKPLKSVMSPPYGDVEKRDRSIEPHYEKEKDYPRGDKNIGAGYQGSDDNIGKLDDKPLKSVMSPPHGLGKGTGHADKKRDTRPILKDRNVNLAYNDENPDNIGNLADKPPKSIVSPPYESQGFKCDENPANLQRREDKRHEKYPIRPKVVPGHYGDTYDNVGNTQGESYLEAMAKVYREISLVSDVLCVVVKNPTRNGKIRRLDSDTCRILELAGWNIFCRHRALLFEELEQAVLIDEVYTMELDLTKAVEQPTFGYKVFITPVIDDEFGIVKFDELKRNYPNLKPNTVYYAPEVVGGTKITIDGKRVAGRLSFFKRLSWKGGATVASWEDIIVCTRK